MPVNVYSCDPKNKHKGATTIDTALGYGDPATG